MGLEFLGFFKWAVDLYKLIRGMTGLSMLEWALIVFVVLLAFKVLIGQKSADKHFRAISRMDRDEDLDRNIMAVMEKIRSRLNATEVLLFQYFAGATSLSGVPGVEVRLTHKVPSELAVRHPEKLEPHAGDGEDATCEIRPVADLSCDFYSIMRRGMLAVTFGAIKSLLEDSRFLDFGDMKRLKRLDPQMYRLFSDLGADSVYIGGMFDPKRRLIGLIAVVDRNERGPLDEDATDYVLEKVGAVERALVFNRYDRRGGDE